MSDRGAESKRIDEALGAAIDHAKASGADDVELSYVGTETQFTRFASSHFTQVGSTHAIHARVRVLVGNRLGSQICASLDRDQLQAAVEGAIAVARMSPTLDVEMSFATPDDAPADSVEAEIPESLSAAKAPALLAEAFRPHGDDGVLFAGSLKAHRKRLAVRTGAGLVRDAATATADTQVIGLCGTASGYAGAYGLATEDAVDFRQLCARASDKARRGFLKTVDLEPGRYDVILAPEAISEVLEWMAEASFGANTLIDETSLLTGKAGQRICHDSITLEERIDEGEPSFDAEGTLRRPVTFIDKGVAGSPVTDRLFARRLEGDAAASTGHAPAADDQWSLGPRVSHMRLAPGMLNPRDLIAKAKGGLFVTRFHYVNGLLDTRKATTTGLTRDGCFLIEDGGILGPAVNTLRFTEDMVAALGRVDGLGDVLRDVPTWWSDGGTVTVPHVLIRDFHFTGKSG